MKILHYSLGIPPFRSGGLTKYSLDLMKHQALDGHQVSLLYPGRMQWIKNNLKIGVSNIYENISVYEIINPADVTLNFGVKDPDSLLARDDHQDEFNDFLQANLPDILHIHTFIGLDEGLLKAAKKMGVPVLYTSHDYFGICPRCTLFNADDAVCKDYADGFRCIKCNRSGLSRKQIFLSQSYSYRYLKDNALIRLLRRKMKASLNRGGRDEHGDDDEDVAERALAYRRLREKYLGYFEGVDCIHFNSSVSRNTYSEYLDKTHVVLSISHSDIKDMRAMKCFTRSSRRLSYIGPPDVFKGYDIVLRLADDIASGKLGDWEVHVYGGPECLQDTKITHHGRFGYSDLEQIFRNTDLLIVPSMWKETFGFIALEGISHGVPVLMSENVGCKDLVEDGRTGWVVEPDYESIRGQLSFISENPGMLETVNANLVGAYQLLTFDTHYRAVMDLYQGLQAKGGKSVI